MWELYETKLNAYGSTPIDRQLNQAKEDFRREAVKNPAYQKALRNGVEEEFLIQRSDKTERFKITAFPGGELNIGDYIEVFGEVFLVYQVRVQNTLNRTGILWLCNYKFRWQSFTSEVIERWGILDSGVYSTTIKGEDDVQYKHKQFRMIVPADEETKKLFVDKRIAVDQMYDQRGNKILNVYQITGYDATSENFGAGSHILYLNLRSDEYNSVTDNYDLILCNYVTPQEEQTPTQELLLTGIYGVSEIRLGTSRYFEPIFYDIDNSPVTGIEPQWTYDTLPSGVTTSIGEDGRLKLTIPDDTALLNSVITINLSGSGHMSVSNKVSIIGL